MYYRVPVKRRLLFLDEEPSCKRRKSIAETLWSPLQNDARFHCQEDTHRSPFLENNLHENSADARQVEAIFPFVDRCPTSDVSLRLGTPGPSMLPLGASTPMVGSPIERTRDVCASSTAGRKESDGQALAEGRAGPSTTSKSIIKGVESLPSARRGKVRSGPPGILPPCTRCRFQCSLKVGDEARAKFHREFWSGSFEHRRHAIHKRVSDHRCVGRNDKPRFPQGGRIRNYSREYYLRDDEGRYIRVCKTMFLHTLGKRTDGFLTSFFASLRTTDGAVPFADHRGGDRRGHPWVEPEIVAHIASFDPEVSHYTRAHAPHRRYLEGTLNVRKLHHDFLSKRPSSGVSYETSQYL